MIEDEYIDDEDEEMPDPRHHNSRLIKAIIACVLLFALFIAIMCISFERNPDSTQPSTLKNAEGNVDNMPKELEIDDDGTAKVSFNNPENPSEKVTVPATVTYNSYTEPTCEQEGVVDCTITYTYEGEEHSYNDVKVIAPTGHEYDGSKYTHDESGHYEVCVKCQKPNTQVAAHDLQADSQNLVSTCKICKATFAMLSFLQNEDGTTYSVSLTPNAEGDVVIPFKVTSDMGADYDSGDELKQDALITGIVANTKTDENGDTTTTGNDKVTSVTIPEGVDKIESGAFSNFTGIEEVVIEGGIDIGDGAFEGCDNLKQVTIGDGDVNIGDNAFKDTPLTSVTIGSEDGDNSGKVTIGNGAFAGTDITSVTIGGDAEIGDGAFENCDNLTNVTIGGDATIGDGAFKGNDNLTDVEIGGSATIGQDAFNGNDKLTDVDIGGTADIDKGAFGDCENLENVNIGNSTDGEESGKSSIDSTAFDNSDKANINVEQGQVEVVVEVPKKDEEGDGSGDGDSDGSSQGTSQGNDKETDDGSGDNTSQDKASGLIDKITTPEGTDVNVVEKEVEPEDTKEDNKGDNQGSEDNKNEEGNKDDGSGDNQGNGDNSGDNKGTEGNTGDNTGDNSGDNKGDNAENNQGDNKGDGSGENQGTENNSGDGSGENQGTENNKGDGSGENQGTENNKGDGSEDNKGTEGNTGDNTGDNSGDNSGDNQGDNSGDNQGDNKGDNSGDNQGDNKGDGSEDNSGDNNNEQSDVTNALANEENVTVKDDGTVTITGSEGVTDTDIVIPEEVDGKSVTEIGQEAFKDKQIDSVVVPESVKTIGNDAFGDNQVDVYYKGTEDEWNEEVSKGNNADKTSGDNSPAITVYFYSETPVIGGWHYRNGVAVPWTEDEVAAYQKQQSGQSGTQTPSEEQEKVNNAVTTQTEDGSGLAVTGIDNESVESGVAVIPEEVDGKPVTVITSIAGGSSGDDGSGDVGTGDTSTDNAVTGVVIPSTVTTIEEGAFNGADDITDVYYNGTEDNWNNINGATNVPEDVNVYYVSDQPTNDGWHYNDDNTPTAWTQEDIDKYEEQKECSHSFSSNSTATCTEAGIITKTCSKCGYVTTEETNALGHNYNSSGVCTRCGWEQAATEGIVYTKIEGKDEYQVTGVSGDAATSQELVISSSYNGMPVTVIGALAFSGDTALTSITIPSSVTKIKTKAFNDCSNLKSITIPSGVTTIADGAFLNCGSLEKITIPAKVTTIGSNAFSGCALSSVIIPDKVTSIGDGAFSSCGQLISVLIPEGVTTIGQKVFDDSTMLSIIYYKSTQDKYSGSKLQTAVNAMNNSNITVYYYSQNYFADGCWYLDDTNLPVIWNIANILILSDPVEGKVSVTGVKNAVESKIVVLAIPAELGGNTITAIGVSAFYNRNTMTKITLPNTITSIGEKAFASCSKLETVVLTEGLQSIGSGAFNGCISLTQMTIPSSVKSIGSSVFGGCTSLETITVAEGNSIFNSIDDRALYKTSSDGVALIAYAIGDKETQFTIPDNITIISDEVFNGCTYLTQVTIGAGVTSINNKAFYKCTSLASVTFGNNVITIGDNAFANTALVNVVIPNSVTTIGASAFESCTSLQTVTIGSKASDESYSGLQSLGNKAFAGCINLNTITIGPVNSMDSSNSSNFAFNNCSNLKTMYFMSDSSTYTSNSLYKAIFASSLRKSLAVYYYTSTQSSTDGNYWHYVDGQPTKW